MNMSGLLLPVTLTNGGEFLIPTTGMPIPLTVWISPTSGDTITYSHSCDGGNTYTVRGSVDVYSEDRLVSGVTHLKFQRTAGSGTTSSVGVC